MCMPVNSFLSGLVQDFPAFTSQSNMLRYQCRAATVGGNGSPRQAQFLSGSGQRQFISGHPVFKVGGGHNIAVLFQCEAIQGTRGYLNIITPCYIKAPFADLCLFKNGDFFERLQHHKTLDVRAQVNGVLFAIVPSNLQLVGSQDLYGCNLHFASHGLASLILLLPHLLEVVNVLTCPSQCSFKSFWIRAFTQYLQAVNSHQRFTVRRLHMKMWRRMVVRVNFDFPVTGMVYGSHANNTRANFSLLQYFSNIPLTTATDATNNNATDPHGQAGLVACIRSQRTTALRGFFVRAVWFRACYDGLYGEAFAPASSSYWSTNPVQSVTRCLVASGDGFNKPIVRVDIMTTLAQNPSSVSQTLAAVICILQSLNADTYTHTRAILAALQAHGIKRDLRSVQRYLVALCDYSLVEHDNHHPKGWKLRTNPNKYAVEAILAMGVQS